MEFQIVHTLLRVRFEVELTVGAIGEDKGNGAVRWGIRAIYRIDGTLHRNISTDDFELGGTGIAALYQEDFIST